MNTTNTTFTTDEKLLLANETMIALDYVSRGLELLNDFIETYIESQDAQQTLIFELQNRHERIEAKMFNLLDIFSTVKEELQKYE